ncbi:hypothetical protein LTR85_001962 [Meristemomyces frigidus]|nr:hypothetical protein LTR85_001962 [Meristemomyces frigidus]
MSTTAQQSCVLLALPPELRNHIYSDVLSTGDVVVIHENGTKPALPPLLQTCRQIRNEALQLYHASNIFRVRVFESQTNTALAWLKSLDPQAGAHIKHMRIEITSYRKLGAELFAKKAVETWKQLGDAIGRARVTSDKVKMVMTPEYEAWLQGRVDDVYINHPHLRYKIAGYTLTAASAYVTAGIHLAIADTRKWPSFVSVG